MAAVLECLKDSALATTMSSRAYASKGVLTRLQVDKVARYAPNDVLAFFKHALRGIAHAQDEGDCLEKDHEVEFGGTLLHVAHVQRHHLPR